MRHKNTKAIYTYWLELFEKAQAPNAVRNIQPRDLRLPERSDLEPSALRALLGDTFILDNKDGVALYRLAGTRLCNLYGRELKGEAFTRVFEGRDSVTTQNWTSTFGKETCLILISTLGENRHADNVSLETLLMPLSHHGVNGERALGLTAPLRPPYWLGSEPVVRQSIRSVRIIRPWEDNVFRANWPFEMPETSLKEEKETVPTFKLGMRRTNDAATGRLTIVSPQAAGDSITTASSCAETAGSTRKVRHLVVHEGGRSEH